LLRAERFGVRIPVVGRFSLPIHTGTEAHVMGTGALSRG
jgi:hypothetical protein